MFIDTERPESVRKGALRRFTKLNLISSSWGHGPMPSETQQQVRRLPKEITPTAKVHEVHGLEEIVTTRGCATLVLGPR